MQKPHSVIVDVIDDYLVWRLHLVTSFDQESFDLRGRAGNVRWRWLVACGNCDGVGTNEDINTIGWILRISEPGHLGSKPRFGIVIGDVESGKERFQTVATFSKDQIGGLHFVQLTLSGDFGCFEQLRFDGFLH